MALNIRNLEVERLAEQIARRTGETKTEVSNPGPFLWSNVSYLLGE